MKKLRVTPRPEKETNVHGNDLMTKNPHYPAWIRTGILIVLLMVIGVLPPCAAENTTIQVGVILPLSGTYEVVGNQLLQGILLAAEEIEQTSDVRGYHVSLRTADDNGDPENALSLYKEMQAEGVPVIIGSYTTTLTLPMAQESRGPASPVLISPRANGEDLYGISPRFYQVNPPIFSLSRFIADWLKYSSDRTSVIYIDDTYGRSVLTHIKSGLSQNDVQFSGEFPLPDDPDYHALTQSVLDTAPDAIVIVVYDSRQIPVIRNLSQAGFKGQVLLTESALMSTLEEEIPDALETFALFTISAYTNLVPGEDADRFVSSYQDRFGEDPSRTPAGYGYDSLMVIADALHSIPCIHGNVTPDMIQEGLNRSNYYGVTGPKVFDAHNAAGTAIDRWGFVNGRLELMGITL
jgi:branched-chain amino acid transport system substrate-binding protein